MQELEQAGRHASISVKASKSLVELSKRFIEEATLLSKACPPDLNVHYSMKSEPEHRVDVVVSANDNERSAILHRLRPFVLSREPLYVPKFLGLFKRENPQPEAVGAADVMRDSFLVRSVPFVVSTRNGEMDFEQQWQDYANAFEYHRDDAKREAIGREFAASPASALFVFWMGVSIKVKAVLQMTGFAAMLSGEKSQFTVTNGPEPR